MLILILIIVAMVSLWVLFIVPRKRASSGAPRATLQANAEFAQSIDRNHLMSDGPRPAGTSKTPDQERVVTLLSPGRDIASGYELDDLYISPISNSALGLNFFAKTIVLGPLKALRSYPLQAIIDVELVRNGVTLTQTNRGSQLLGAAVGAAALGGAGALVGGLTGSSRSRDRLAELSLKIIIEDHITPVHVISVLSTPRGKGVDPRSAKGQKALSQLERLHGLVLAAMRTASADVKSHSSADSVEILERLWKLREGGAITDEEFAEQKARLSTKVEPETEVSESTPDWDDRATVRIQNWNGKPPIHFFAGLREILSDIDAVQVVNKAKKAPCAIKANTPGDALRLKNLFASGGVTF